MPYRNHSRIFKCGGITKFFVDDLSNIYTVDQNNRIQKWASGGLEWTTVAGSNGEVDRPNSVFVDKTGNIYVSDSYNHRVPNIKAHD
jgi:dipeptidyl aminopeptidase/acylaminoacyl peptidase